MNYPKQFYRGIATLTGCVIGAGILGIPYVVQKSGFWTGMLVLVMIGVAMLLVHLMVGDIARASKKFSQLTGYAHDLLGRKWMLLMLVSMIIGINGAMVAYTIGVSESLAGMFGGSSAWWGVLFYVIMSVILLGGVDVLGKSEVWMESIKFTVLALLLTVLFFAPQFSTSPFTGFSLSNLLIPYGVILFAYIGTAAVPELCEEMRSCRKFTRRAIVIGSLLPMLVYFLFTAAVIGVSKSATTEISTIGISAILGARAAFAFHLFAILAMSSSFAALGFALKETFWKDVGLSHLSAWSLTLAVPAVLLLVGVNSFVKTLELTGAFAGGITCLLVIVMHAKLRRGSILMYLLLASLFIAGMVYQL